MVFAKFRILWSLFCDSGRTSTWQQPKTSTSSHIHLVADFHHYPPKSKEFEDAQNGVNGLTRMPPNCIHWYRGVRLIVAEEGRCCKENTIRHPGTHSEATIRLQIGAEMFCFGWLRVRKVEWRVVAGLNCWSTKKRVRRRSFEDISRILDPDLKICWWSRNQPRDSWRP